MILFFMRGEADSDMFVKYCYKHYRDIIGDDSLPHSVEILRKEGVKPRFDCEDIYFNLSHSDGVIMLGISHTPIGVDIERVREIDISKFPFIQAEDEEEFFERWTERESYVKMTGEGIVGIRKPVPEDAHFEHFPVYDGYHACVCAEEQNILAYEMDPSAVV